MFGVPQQPSAQPPRPEAVQDLIESLRLFTVESDVFVDVFARAHGLGRSDLNAIMWISAGTEGGGPMSTGELATRLGLGAPATSALVDRLESAGHVLRTRDPADRRRVTISMQAPALELARAFFQPLGRLMTEAVAGSSTGELRGATAIIRELTTAVVTARESTGSGGDHRPPDRS
jgi:DNA-binding MarR family transcriptional regulator